MEEKATPKNKSRFQATGRRKRAVANVFLSEGTGKIRVNKRPLERYFLRETHRLKIVQPFNVTNTSGNYNIRANIKGGGMTGQAEALRHGISRALVLLDSAHRKALKQNGFLTRDPRRKERKKYGRKRARRRFQYSKR